MASLRWLVSEGEARGVRRLAVELRALREALTTLDETRRARDEHAERAHALDLEIQEALLLLGDATHVDGNGSLVARLTRLREILGRDFATRRALIQERNSWRAMCEFQTRTRAAVHTMLEESEVARELLASEASTLRDRMTVLASVHQDTVHEVVAQRAQLLQLGERLALLEQERDAAVLQAQETSGELAALRTRLQHWSGTVERALAELSRAAGALGIN